MKLSYFKFSNKNNSKIIQIKFKGFRIHYITIVAIIVLVILILLIKGVIKTFKRQPIVAMICMIFLLPIYLVWAFLEIFTGTIEK